MRVLKSVGSAPGTLLNVRSAELWTVIDGVTSADPRVVPESSSRNTRAAFSP